MKINAVIHQKLIHFLFFSFLLAVACSTPDHNNRQVNSIAVTITSGDKKFLLSSIEPLAFGRDSVNGPIIEVDTTQRFQTIDGFGYSLTGGSAYLLKRILTDQQRGDLLKELFATDETGIGVSYLRISIGPPTWMMKYFPTVIWRRAKPIPRLVLSPFPPMRRISSRY